MNKGQNNNGHLLAKLEPGQPWDIMPTETPMAFAAFMKYLELPAKERRAVIAYRNFSGNTTAKKPTGTFLHWMADNEWRERVAQYDSHLAKLARAERERQHITKLEAFQERQRGLGAATIQSAVKLLALINTKITSMEAGEINTKQLPSYLRAAAAVAEAATNSEATALSVEQLLSQMNEE